MRRDPGLGRPTPAPAAGSGPPDRPPDEPGRARSRPVGSATDPPSSAVRPASRNSRARAPGAAAHRSTAGPRDDGVGASPRPSRPLPEDPRPGRRPRPPTPTRMAQPTDGAGVRTPARREARPRVEPRGNHRNEAPAPPAPRRVRPEEAPRSRLPGDSGAHENPKRLRSGDGATIGGTLAPLPGPPAGCPCCPCCSAPRWPRRYRGYGAAFLLAGVLVTGVLVRDASFPGGCSEGDAGVVGVVVGSGSWVGEAESGQLGDGTAAGEEASGVGAGCTGTGVAGYEAPPPSFVEGPPRWPATSTTPPQASSTAASTDSPAEARSARGAVVRGSVSTLSPRIPGRPARTRSP